MMPPAARDVARRRFKRYVHAHLVVTLVLLSYVTLYGWVVRQTDHSPFAPGSIVGLTLLLIGIMLWLLVVAMIVSEATMVLHPPGVITLPRRDDSFDRQDTARTDSTDESDR